MEILVCVKQVPDTAEVKIDPVKHTVIRAGVPNIFNPFDQNALEAALQLKDNQGAKVTVLSMGPPQAKDVLREALAVATRLKQSLGTGGSARGGEILIQGDRRKDVASLLTGMGYKTRII